MAWVKLDDQFADHPKVADAGPLAAWMHVKALVYCGRYLTDGYIPRSVAHTLVDWSSAGVMVETGGNQFAGACDTPTCAQLAASLVSVGLWEEAENGYQIHDYLEHNPPAAKVKAEREAEKARKAAGRSKQGRDPLTGRIVSAPPSARTTAGRPPGQPPDVRPESARNPGHVPPVPSPSPSPVVDLKENARARTTAVRDQLVALLATSAELADESVDLDRLARTLRADTVGGGWNERRIEACLPKALDQLALSSKPGLNPHAFVVQAVRRLARPGALEVETQAQDVKMHWRTEKATALVETYRASKAESSDDFAAREAAEAERLTEQTARERSRRNTGEASIGDLFARKGAA